MPRNKPLYREIGRQVPRGLLIEQEAFAVGRAFLIAAVPFILWGACLIWVRPEAARSTVLLLPGIPAAIFLSIGTGLVFLKQWTELDPAAGKARVGFRTPFGTRLREYPFKAIREVAIVRLTAGRGNVGLCLRVLLRMSDGKQVTVVSASDPFGDRIPPLAARIAEMTGAPLVDGGPSSPS